MYQYNCNDVSQLLINHNVLALSYVLSPKLASSNPKKLNHHAETGGKCNLFFPFTNTHRVWHWCQLQKFQIYKRHCAPARIIVSSM